MLGCIIILNLPKISPVEFVNVKVTLGIHKSVGTTNLNEVKCVEFVEEQLRLFAETLQQNYLT